MTLGGRRRHVDVAVPECASRQCIVEVLLASDGDDAVPLDRTEARAASVTVFLPAGRRVKIRVLDTNAQVLRTIER
jgi:hypothetical protein